MSEHKDFDTDLFVNGTWRPSADDGTLRVINPAKDEPLAQVAAATAADVDDAVRAARAQFDGGTWSRLSGRERGRLLLRLAELIERDIERFALIEALDVGKPLNEPRMLDIPMAARTVEYFAGWADKLEGRVIPTPGYFGRATHSYTVREPLGVVGAITPWNAPTMIACWKLAPALAAGCTVVLKPSEDAPLSSLLLARLVEEAGFPPGTVNVVPGLGHVAGAALVRHPGVDKISFTGSVEVGREIQRMAADTLKPVALELGGKSPQIICEDADLGEAVAGTAMGLFFNQGEICAAGTRVLVHSTHYDAVVSALADAAAQVKLGDPLSPDTTMGALINRTQRDRVLDYIEAGEREGARLVTSRARHDGPGYFVRPAIFADADNTMRIAREEIFGPVGTVIPFDSDEQAVRMANDNPYGLAAGVWTRSDSRGHRLAAQLRAGAVWVNAWAAIDPSLPWGGYKNSGIGRELGWNGIAANTEEKVVTVVL